jgi:site-specific DNA-methyltransferase (adenine-specific)
MWERINKLSNDNTPTILFCQEPFGSTLRASNIKNYKYDWIWEKSNPSNIALANKQPMRYHELVSVFYKKQPTYNKQMIVRDSPRIKQAQDSNYVFHNSQSEQTALKYIEVDSNKYDKDFKNPSTILKFNSLRPNAKEFVKHPTQKPVALLEYLIKTYTNKGDTVLDFTMGSGSTGVACLNTNRNFIGIELDETYFNLATERIKNNMKEGDSIICHP